MPLLPIKIGIIESRVRKPEEHYLSILPLQMARTIYTWDSIEL
jgi:hypothetical protein